MNSSKKFRPVATQDIAEQDQDFDDSQFQMQFAYIVTTSCEDQDNAQGSLVPVYQNGSDMDASFNGTPQENE
ncbi:hypothetical protein BGZ76_006117 [Entomortierella beljakovae]|nr:hypothetical protein BGZ76_006117 [Entomortierella beljakovae]